MPLLTISHTILLLEYYKGSELPPRDDNTFRLCYTQELLHELAELGLMIQAAALPAGAPTRSRWQITKHGQAHIAALLRTPIPVERTEWVTHYPAETEQ